jgi:hypothetical protein
MALSSGGPRSPDGPSAHPQGAVLALTWRAMLRNFLGEAAANDDEMAPGFGLDEAFEPFDKLSRVQPFRESLPASWPADKPAAAPQVAVQWVESLLRQALAEVDTWFDDPAAVENDLDPFEPLHGYRFARRAAEGSRRGSPAAPRD